VTVIDGKRATPKSGGVIDADIVVVGAGVRPGLDWPKTCDGEEPGRRIARRRVKAGVQLWVNGRKFPPRHARACPGHPRL
jgi:hypothetical protein